MSASDQFTQGAEVASGSHNPASVSSIPTPASNFAGHLPADTMRSPAAVRALRQLSWDGACGPKLSRIVCQEGRKELDQALRSLCIGLVLCRVPLPTC